jgi:DNA-binding NtrC family response regulator
VSAELTKPEESKAVNERVECAAIDLHEQDSTGDQPTLFIIDDDIEHSASLERLLSRAGLITKIFSSVDTAVSYMSETMPRWILCDAHMPDGGAEKLLQILTTTKQAARCAVMSGETNDDLLYRCAALGAREFFQKPLAVDRVIAWASQGTVTTGRVASG